MDSINQIWPKWHTQELLGKGAFGEVYKVKREELGETFYSAVKVIRIPHDTEEIKELMDEGHTSQSIRYYYESIAQGLMNEIKVLEILKSAGNVVNIEEFEIHERTDSVGWDAYIRMELLKNLNEYRRGHKMDVKETAKMGMDICHALICCEQSRIIHRDIKPSNIFVDAYGNFKLGDFGIARQMEKTRSTLSQKGTEMYMAPEVRFGDGQSSYNVDIYSLGLVMYRLLNKNRMPFEPFDAELISYQDKEAALTRRLRGEELPLPAEAPEALGRIVLKACEADKEKRYQSASQMYADLDCWMRGGTAEHKRGQRQSTQSRREDKASGKPQKTDNGLYGVERTPQVKQFALFEEGSFDAYTPQRRTHVEEEIGRKIIGQFDDVYKLPGTVQLLAYGVVVGRKLHSIGIIHAQGAEASLLDERPDLVESYLLLEILRIYHTRGFRKMIANVIKRAVIIVI